MATTKLTPSSTLGLKKVLVRQSRLACISDVQECVPYNAPNSFARRDILSGGVLGVATLLSASNIQVAHAESIVTSVLCDPDCVEQLNGSDIQTTESGLQYTDIKLGKGPPPPIGYQVVVHYVAMTPDGKIFDSSFDRGAPYDLRVGAEALIKGLDEGLSTMRTGGVRRLYVPGNLAFPKPLAAAPGRGRIAANAPCIFDVSLLYIPGVDVDDE